MHVHTRSGPESWDGMLAPRIVAPWLPGPREWFGDPIGVPITLRVCTLDCLWCAHPILAVCTDFRPLSGSAARSLCAVLSGRGWRPLLPSLPGAVMLRRETFPPRSRCLPRRRAGGFSAS